VDLAELLQLPEKTNPIRRWPRFSLRSLALFVALAETD
jgi:hypothetical protein